MPARLTERPRHRGVEAFSSRRALLAAGAVVVGAGRALVARSAGAVRAAVATVRFVLGHGKSLQSFSQKSRHFTFLCIIHDVVNSSLLKRSIAEGLGAFAIVFFG